MAKWPKGGITMLRQTTRKFAIIATVVFSCVAVAACGNTGSAGNDAIRAKEVAATRAVVTTAAEKTEATTTTTSSTETTTSKSKTTTTTTTTTAATTTAEPETVKTTATTTTAATTTAEPEITETEATTAEEPEKTGVQTSRIDLTATMPVETEEPKDSNMMTVEDCIKKIVKENIDEEVVSIELNDKQTYFTITTNNGSSIVMIARDVISEYDSGELVDYNSFSYSYNDNGTDAIFHSKNES